jgi:hypothetical protein
LGNGDSSRVPISFDEVQAQRTSTLTAYSSDDSTDSSAATLQK